MKKLLVFLFCLFFLPVALSESPSSLRECVTKDEVLQFVDFPSENDLPAVISGRIRYIMQEPGKACFVKSWWIGDEEGGPLDLTRTENKFGSPYLFSAKNMCTRATCSMALSYLGIDVTPGGMSAMTGKRNLDEDYQEVTSLIEGLSFVGSNDPRTMDEKVENYLSDENYSPVMITLQKTNDSTHSLLIVGKDDEGRFLVIDPSEKFSNGKHAYIQYLRFNKNRLTILNATVYNAYNNASLMRCCQWHISH